MYINNLLCLWIDQVFIKLNYWLQWFCRELNFVEGSTYLLFENKVNFSLALWNFNSWNSFLLKYCYCSCITIFIVHKMWSQLIYLAVYIVYKQVILMMCEYVYRHVPPNQPLTARDAEPPPSGKTTSARCVIDHQSEVYIITCIMLHTCS